MPAGAIKRSTKSLVVILDLPYREKDLRDFQSFLKNRTLQTIPVIYNDRCLPEEGRNCGLFDDIIDLGNWQFDLSTKVSFLKRSKEYDLTRSAGKYNVNPSTSVGKRVFDILVAYLGFW